VCVWLSDGLRRQAEMNRLCCVCYSFSCIVLWRRVDTHFIRSHSHWSRDASGDVSKATCIKYTHSLIFYCLLFSSSSSSDHSHISLHDYVTKWFHFNLRLAFSSICERSFIGKRLAKWDYYGSVKVTSCTHTHSHLLATISVNLNRIEWK